MQNIDSPQEKAPKIEKILLIFGWVHSSVK